MSLTYYVDGVSNGHVEQYISRRPQFLLISTEVNGYRNVDPLPAEQAFENQGDTFLVDYVRVLDILP